MTREEAYNRIDAIIAKYEIDDEYVTITNEKDYDALRMARKVLGQEPCNDAISRQAVLEIIHHFFTEEVDRIPTKKTEDGEVYVIHKCQPLFEMNKTICKRIKALPSASPIQNCVGNALDMRCGDAISRQKVLDVINLNWDYRRNCIRAIEKLPPVKQEQSSSENPNKWIPVSERLPKEDTNVLCWYEYFRYGNYNKMYQTYGVGTYFGRFGWAGDITGDQARVIAWMPLPKPYKPQESEE